MRRPITFAVLLAMPAAAHAFCGVYVAGEGNEVTNHASQVILAHHADRTTLTIAADAGGGADDFGLLIPLPGDVGQEDITLADAELFARIDQYSAPREVAYTCDTARGSYKDSSGLGCVRYDMEMSDGSSRDDDGVDVQELFTIGEYEIAIVQASEAGAMQGWLDEHHFAAPEDPDGVLQRYLDGGSRFMAARVILDAVPAGQEWLHPIQFSFDQPGNTLGLPIEIGTISAHGARQDVVLYVFGDRAQGNARIENYPEVKPDDECMRPSDTDITSFYDAAVNEALGDAAGWVQEYAIAVDNSGYHCDPCTAPSLEGALLDAIGWDGDPDVGARFTRLRMRYSADQLHGDLDIAFEGSEATVALSQLRYIEYNHDLEYLYPVCAEGYVDNPGECPDEAGEAACAVPVGGAPPVLALFLAMFGALRRRRT